MKLWSVQRSLFLPLIPPHTFPCHGLQSFRKRLLQPGSLTGRSSCQGPAPPWVLCGMQLCSGHICLLQYGFLHRLWCGPPLAAAAASFTVVLFMGCREFLLHHGLLSGLLGNLCSGTWSTVSLSFSADLGAYGIFSLLLCLTTAVQCFLSFINYVIMEVSQLG